MCLVYASSFKRSTKESKLKRQFDAKHPSHISKQISFFERKEVAVKRQRLDGPDQKHNFQTLSNLTMASFLVAWQKATHNC